MINYLSVTDDEILDLLKSFELFDDENRYSLDQQISNKSLSSGQMQKIAFVRALLAKVELLLLDESTANLDDKTRNKIFNIFIEGFFCFLIAFVYTRLLNMRPQCDFIPVEIVK